MSDCSIKWWPPKTTFVENFLAKRASFARSLLGKNFSTFLTRRGLYLEDLYVTPKCRGKGYGKQLMRHLARVAKQEGCGRFEWSVLDWNEPAIGFYESLGATVMLDWRICRLTGEALDRFAGNEGSK